MERAHLENYSSLFLVFRAKIIAIKMHYELEMDFSFQMSLFFCLNVQASHKRK